MLGGHYSSSKSILCMKAKVLKNRFLNRISVNCISRLPLLFHPFSKRTRYDPFSSSSFLRWLCRLAGLASVGLRREGGTVEKEKVMEEASAFPFLFPWERQKTWHACHVASKIGQRCVLSGVGRLAEDLRRNHTRKK